MAQLSPLRGRTIEDMTVRNMSPATQRSYVSAVSKFSRNFGRSQGDRFGTSHVFRLFGPGSRLRAGWRDGRGEGRPGGSPPSKSQTRGQMADRTFAGSSARARRRALGGLPEE
jgi:hypothetical protein